MKTEIESTPLIDRISDEIYNSILNDSRAALAAFTDEDGRTEAPIKGHLINARKVSDLAE